MRRTIVIILAVASTGCGLFDGTNVTYEVQHYKGQCFGLFVTLCLQTRLPGETQFLNMFQTPEGFQYEWGFTYVIDVREEPVDNPPADGSSIRRILRNVVLKTPADRGAPFSLTLTNRYETIVENVPWVFTVHGQRDFTCLPPVDCDGLRAELAAGSTLQYDFRHPASSDDPLVLDAWTLVQQP